MLEFIVLNLEHQPKESVLRVAFMVGPRADRMTLARAAMRVREQTNLPRQK